MLFKSNVFYLGEKKEKNPKKLDNVRIWMFLLAKYKKNWGRWKLLHIALLSPYPPFFLNCPHVLAACFPFGELVQVQRVNSE